MSTRVDDKNVIAAFVAPFLLSNLSASFLLLYRTGHTNNGLLSSSESASRDLTSNLILVTSDCVIGDIGNKGVVIKDTDNNAGWS